MKTWAFEINKGYETEYGMIEAVSADAAKAQVTAYYKQMGIDVKEAKFRITVDEPQYNAFGLHIIHSDYRGE